MPVVGARRRASVRMVPGVLCPSVVDVLVEAVEAVAEEVVVASDEDVLDPPPDSWGVQAGKKVRTVMRKKRESKAAVRPCPCRVVESFVSVRAALPLADIQLDKS